MKDVLLLYDNDRPHSGFCALETIAKLGCVFFPILLKTQNLQPPATSLWLYEEYTAWTPFCR
jgi:hypothetical protein